VHPSAKSCVHGLKLGKRMMSRVIDRFGVNSESSDKTVDIVTINVNEIGGKWAYFKLKNT